MARKKSKGYSGSNSNNNGGKYSPVLIKGSMLLNNTGNINFSQELGPVLPLPNLVIPESMGSVTQLGTPTGIAGLMVIDTIPTYGKMVDANSAINVAAFDLYTMDRAANSGASNYDAPDLMQYILAMDSASMFISYLKTAYGLMKEFRTLNRLYPRAILEAMGFNYANYLDNLPAFRSFINIAIAEFNAKKVPALPIFDYHYNRFSTIFKDSDNEKSQLFVYRLKGLYEFVDANPTPNQAGFLAYHDLQEDNVFSSLDTVIAEWNTIIGGIQGSGTFYNMSGDIQKAWNSFAQIPEMPEDYRTPILKDSIQLKELHNATITKPLSHGEVYNAPLNIYQDVQTNQLRQTIQSLQGTAPNPGPVDFGITITDRIINTDSETPSPSEVVTMTANMVYGSVAYAGSNTMKATITDYGLFIYSNAYIWAFRNNAYQSVADFGTYINEATDFTTEAAFAHFQAGLDQFSWKPLNYVYQTANPGSATVNVQFQPEPLNDLDNFTTVHKITVQNIQKANTLGAFNVPNQSSLTSR